MAGSKATHSSSAGRVGVSKYLQNEIICTMVESGCPVILNHILHPGERWTHCENRDSRWSVPWWGPGEHDWVGVRDSQGKQTVKCKTVCFSLVFKAKVAFLVIVTHWDICLSRNWQLKSYLVLLLSGYLFHKCHYNFQPLCKDHSPWLCMIIEQPECPIFFSYYLNHLFVHFLIYIHNDLPFTKLWEIVGGGAQNFTLALRC